MYQKAPLGKVNWKFVFSDGVYYRLALKDAVSYFYRNAKGDRAFDIYHNARNGGWTYVANYTPSDTCSCGRLYTDSEKGLDFKYVPAQLIKPTSEENVIRILQSPILCQVCFYRQELKAGRFCPRWVKNQLNYNS